jgi:hypothetical protein
MRKPFKYWPQKWIPGNVKIVAPTGSVPAPYLGNDVMLDPSRPLATEMAPGKYMPLPQIMFAPGQGTKVANRV